jgi:hypothetical protein
VWPDRTHASPIEPEGRSLKRPAHPLRASGRARPFPFLSVGINMAVYSPVFSRITKVVQYGWHGAREDVKSLNACATPSPMR